MSKILWKDKTLKVLRCVFAVCSLALIVVLVLILVRHSVRINAEKNIKKNVIEVVHKPKGK